MTKIIDGKKLAEQMKDDLVKQIQKLPSRPNLAIILVGQKTDSCLYVSLKEKESKKVGIDTNCYKFEEEVTEEKLINCIEFLNNDEQIDGILIQLPLPKKFNTAKIINSIKPSKDVDGFHPENLKKIHSNLPLFTKEGAGERSYIMPPLAGVILEMLASINFDLKKKKIALVANSDIFMQGVGDILKQHDAEIIICSPNDQDIFSKTKLADVIVTAVGKKHYLTTDHIKKDAIIIDIGIIKEGKETFGDVDFDSVTEKASYISPVPGGVGPMTIALAFKNVLKLHRTTHNI